MPITRNTEEKKRMKVGILAILMAFLLAAGIPFGAMAGVVPDTDSDTVPDNVDNCTTVPNGVATTNQCDADSDGYGNDCDADPDNNGGVGISDYTTFLGYWNKQVGPSGLSCAGSVPCP
jgi:hypothetical protein